MVPAEIGNVLCVTKPNIDNVRWLKPEKYHITFEYFAELPGKLIQEVHRKIVLLSKYFPLTCEVECFSGFPSNRRARVVVALLRLANTDIGSVCDIKRFTPHVTVGYARSRKVYVPQTSFDLQFSFERPALFRSEKGLYTEMTSNNT